MKTKWKIFWLFLILFAIFILFLFFLSQLNSDGNNKITLFDKENNIFSKKESIESKSQVKTEVLNEDIQIIFCPGNRCFEVYKNTINLAQNEIVCAFYEFDFLNLSNVLKEKSNNGIKVSIITDNEYLKEIGITNLNNTNIEIFSDIDRGTRYDNYMHHKFCVIDSKILILGSANPTNNDFLKNNNNILKINSKYLAENYRAEFYEMKSSSFGYKTWMGLFWHRGS